MMHHYALGILFLFYIVLMIQFIRERQRINAANWVFAALLCWPFILTDEFIRMTGEGTSFIGLTVFVPVLIITCLYRAVKLLVIDNPPPSKLMLWLPLGLTLLGQLAIVFVPVAERMSWAATSPVGDPLGHKAVYLTSMLAGFSVLVLGILISEMVQNYHRYLSSQVAEIARFKVRWVGGSIGICVGSAFCCILLVTAGTFGFFNVIFWQSLINLLQAIAMLLVLLALIRPQHTSPSPLDYYRLDELKAEQSVMREALARAQATMVSSEAYKTPGLTLKTFAKECKVEPTTLTIALRLLEKRDFRSFVHQYRLEHAQTILIPNNERLANLAKRFGVQSDRFLNDVLSAYFKNAQ
ncbi:DNA mismatch repair protein [Alteromonas sp. C1M14]|uniref:DNA mismatch repair protein n=1 Tax=Alteromonas sp. C1M14 TaxID=2841567 RepID=UPI001C0862AD|nr:DNA mismatch repair protein [Alteromonas sp. C1M14]MBU2977534.1 DNA mismatch repair protein [Alteromonas sp. C1M14]